MFLSVSNPLLLWCREYCIKDMASKLVLGATTASKFVKGLPFIFRRLEEMGPTVAQSIIPSQLHRTTRIQKKFTVRIMSENENGYKLVAIRDQTLQEFFVVTDLSKKSMQYCVDEVTGKNFLQRIQGKAVAVPEELSQN
eukprot:m.88601 g.88601  ORF g.88601 m.88601 type:complete len:139 (+) comp8811_c0_seq15:1792-2208(+)